MAGSDDAPDATEWRRTSKFYRRVPGLPWLIGLVVIPLLLAVISYGEPGRTRSEATGPFLFSDGNAPAARVAQ